jgi:hypothetical protein
MLLTITGKSAQDGNRTSYFAFIYFLRQEPPAVATAYRRSDSPLQFAHFLTPPLGWPINFCLTFQVCSTCSTLTHTNAYRYISSAASKDANKCAGHASCANTHVALPYEATSWLVDDGTSHTSQPEVYIKILGPAELVRVRHDRHASLSLHLAAIIAFILSSFCFACSLHAFLHWCICVCFWRRALSRTAALPGSSNWTDGV